MDDDAPPTGSVGKFRSDIKIKAVPKVIPGPKYLLTLDQEYPCNCSVISLLSWVLDRPIYTMNCYYPLHKRHFSLHTLCHNTLEPISSIIPLSGTAISITTPGNLPDFDPSVVPPTRMSNSASEASHT